LLSEISNYSFLVIVWVLR